MWLKPSAVIPLCPWGHRLQELVPEPQAPYRNSVGQEIQLALCILRSHIQEFRPIGWIRFNQLNPILAEPVCANGEGNGTPLQYSCLENPMDRGAWWAPVHGVAKSQTQLSDFTFTFHFHALKKEMATHSSVLAQRIPGTGEPGGLPSMGSHRVGHDWSDSSSGSVCKICEWKGQTVSWWWDPSV